MNFEDYMNRVEITHIADYILYGVESFSRPSKKSYEQRLREADKKARAFFEKRYTDRKEYDEIAGYYAEQTYEYMKIYFEIGLLLGGKLGCEIHKKLIELGADYEGEGD